MGLATATSDNDAAKKRKRFYLKPPGKSPDERSTLASPQGNAEKKMKWEVKTQQQLESGSEEEVGTIDRCQPFVSEYELERQRNIEERLKLFRELNLDEAKKNFKDVTDKLANRASKSSRRGLKTTKEKAPLPPRRKSLRLQRIAPDGTHLPEPPPAEEPEEEHARKPSGSLSMKDIRLRKEDEEICVKFLSKWQSQMNGGKQAKFKMTDLESFRKTLASLTLKEESIAKVVPNRLFSLAVHPTESRLLIAAGGKWGAVGLWTVDAVDDPQEGVHAFEPHSRPVNYINFCKFNPVRLFSCSYDGTLRCADFEKQVFDEIYATPVDLSHGWLQWHEQISPHTLLVGQGNGVVSLVDTRTEGIKAEKAYQCYPRSVRTISLHPLKTTYFLTSSATGTVDVWDIRCMKKRNNIPICSARHRKSLSSAQFSPVTGNRIVTVCADDTLTLYDTAEFAAGNMPVLSVISHNNYTGRWLTTFKAKWHPNRDDTFVCGSMVRPRQIEVFGEAGQMIHKFRSEFLQSVCSINEFHPTLPIVVGGNSSGRVHVFK